MDLLEGSLLGNFQIDSAPKSTARGIQTLPGANEKIFSHFPFSRNWALQATVRILK
jgi:hypothetical protein